MWIRISILSMLLIVSILNACLRRWEEKFDFVGILILQLMAIREIWAYLFNKTMWLWNGPDIKNDSQSLGRIFFCSFYVLCYLILFFKN